MVERCVGFRFVVHCLLSTVAIDVKTDGCNAHPAACLYPRPTNLLNVIALTLCPATFVLLF
jgi:hypothetical protein